MNRADLMPHRLRGTLWPPIEPDYRFTRHLATGGSAIIMQAEQLDGGPDVAVKVMHPELAAHPIARQRFITETRIQFALKHPNIVPLIDHGECVGCPWLAMVLLPGGSAAQRLKRFGTFDVEVAVLLALDVLDALDYCHRVGVVHRDIKPDNILFDEHDQAYLIDFGIARDPDIKQTMIGDQLGTPAFMSPEQQLSPTRATVRSDVYSVAATLYHLVTGRNPMALSLAHSTRRAAMTTVPEPLGEVLRLATHPDVARRPTSAMALADQLEDVLDALGAEE